MSYCLLLQCNSRRVATAAIIILLAILVFSSTVFGTAWTTEQLSDQLAQSSDEASLSVLVFLGNQLDVGQVRASRNLNDAGRSEVHRVVCEGLQAFANSSQADIRTLLNSQMVNGSVINYEHYWIANALQVEAKPAVIKQLMQRSDVAAVIEDVPLEALYNPVQPQEGSATVSGAADNLRAIGADSMWAMGFTGQGRLICSFDSGVEGTHPALAESWRGLTHSSAESWFDPVYEESFPHRAANINFSTAIHGTMTMGVMVGKNDASGDTTGVAFGAEWISAMVIDIPGANYLEAFQWAADPDGDPSTIEDVPDVLNNSWGFRQSIIDCMDIFWAPIDNLEALGCVCIFAAGNEGLEGTMSIRNPANRATTETSNFAVGATNLTGESIWSRSSKGPSDCDGISIKPEVVAPGEDIRTTSVSNVTGIPEYSTVAGTSFSAPHIAGAVALLRQVNPNATVEEIKLALMNSAADRGESGEDNTYGHGLINIPAAMALLPPNAEVNLYVKSIEYDPITPGDFVEFVVELKNSGVAAPGVTGYLTNPAYGATIVSGTAEFGDIATDSSASNSENPYIMKVIDDFPHGGSATVDMLVFDDDNYESTIKLHLLVGGKLVKSKQTLTTDSLSFTITNYGIYGLASGSVANGGGVGFVYNETNQNNLYSCSFMMGISPTAVSDALPNLVGTIDADFAVAPNGNLVAQSNGGVGDHETYSRFDDSQSFTPVGITVVQKSATFDGQENGNFVILEYTLRNEGDAPVNNLYAGMYFDWDFPFGSGAFDRVSFSRDPDHPDIGFTWQNNTSNYRGTAVLNEESASTFWAIWNADVTYDGVSEAEKYQFLANGLQDSANTATGDQSYSIVSGPFDLGPGEANKVAFAVLASNNKERLFDLAGFAKQLYDQFEIGDSDDNGMIEVSDAVYLINYIFGGGFQPDPVAEGDANCDGLITIADVVRIINYIFGGGSAPCER